MVTRLNKLVRPSKAQTKALHDLYRRSPDSHRMSFLAFRRRARFHFFDECLMIDFCGMLVGIEVDGYTHS